MALPAFLEKQKIIHWAKAFLDTDGNPQGFDHVDGRIKTVTTSADGTAINPATEEKQDEAIALLRGSSLVLNRYLANFHDHGTTLSVAAAPGDIQISIQASDYASFAVEDRLFLSAGGPIQENYFPTITAKPGSPILTINKPLDFPYPIGSEVQHVVINAAAEAGSLASPISFRLQPPPGVTFNVTGAIAALQFESAGDYSRFGDIAGGLTNGVVSRAQISGILRARSVYRTNSDFDDDSTDPIIFHDKAGGGDFGMQITWIFNKFGTYIPISGDGAGGGDYFEQLIQDDLTSLSFARSRVHGYVTIN